MNRIRALLRLRTWLGPAALLALSVVATMQWPQAPHSRLPETSIVSLAIPTDAPTGPVEIVGVSASPVWSDSLLPKVTVSVRNLRAEAVTTDVWWLLAPVGKPDPWNGPASRGVPTRIRLAPLETTAVNVAADGVPPEGTWTLSLWAHSVQNQNTEHSHGAATTPIVHVLATHPDVSRLTQPGEHAVLTSLQPAGRLRGTGSDSGSPDALVSVQATTQQPVGVELRCYLAPSGVNEPWTEPRAFGSGVEHLLADGSGRQQGTCRFPHLPAGGQWQLSAFLRTEGGEAGGAHEDGLYLRQPLRVRPIFDF